jgi:hypothetical protein
LEKKKTLKRIHLKKGGDKSLPGRELTHKTISFRGERGNETARILGRSPATVSRVSKLKISKAVATTEAVRLVEAKLEAA